jgi:prefoldin subunit 5
MAVKKLELLVPADAVLSIDSLTPDQNYIMLKIGSGYLLEGQNAGAGLTHKEICQNIGDKSWERIGHPTQWLPGKNVPVDAKMEIDANLYEGQIRKLETQLKALRDELLKYGVDLPL